MHVYLVDKDMQWILLPTWSYMCGECTDATFLHLIGRVSDRYWTSLPPTRGSRRRRVDTSFQTISPLKYGWSCKHSYLNTCPEYLEIMVYNLVSFETPIMTCIKSSPVRYIDMTYRLSIYRHFWKISISISIWSYLKISISISISIRQFQKYRYRYRYRYGDFGKYRYRYRYR